MNYENDDILNEVDTNIELLVYNDYSEIKLQDIAYYITLGETRLNDLRNELQSELDRYKLEYDNIAGKISRFDYSNINNYKYTCERYIKFLNDDEDINTHVRIFDLYKIYKKDISELENLNKQKNDLVEIFNHKVSESQEKYDFLVNKLYVYSMYGDLSINRIEPLNVNLVVET